MTEEEEKEKCEDDMKWWNGPKLVCQCGGEFRRALSYTFPAMFMLDCQKCGIRIDSWSATDAREMFTQYTGIDPEQFLNFGHLQEESL